MGTKKEEMKRAAELATVLVESASLKCRVLYGNFVVANTANVLELIKLADGVKRRAVNECNFSHDQAALDRNDRADAKAYARAAEIAAHYGATVRKMEDARGFAIRLELPTKRSNSFGGEGWGV